MAEENPSTMREIFGANIVLQKIQEPHIQKTSAKKQKEERADEEQ